MVRMGNETHVYEHMENRSVTQASAAITTPSSCVCVMDLLSASVYPVHQLVSTLTLLIQVHLQLMDPLLQTPTQAATCDGLGLILCNAPDKNHLHVGCESALIQLHTSMILMCRALSSLALVLLSASSSSSWTFFSSTFSLTMASSRSL